MPIVYFLKYVSGVSEKGVKLLRLKKGLKIDIGKEMVSDRHADRQGDREPSMS